MKKLLIIIIVLIQIIVLLMILTLHFLELSYLSKEILFFDNVISKAFMIDLLLFLIILVQLLLISFELSLLLKNSV